MQTSCREVSSFTLFKDYGMVGSDFCGLKKGKVNVSWVGRGVSFNCGLYSQACAKGSLWKSPRVGQSIHVSLHCI